jgi:uncharacterized membrane protein YphA (DoxX/SURF4 family)
VTKTFALGKALFALAMAGIGVQCIIRGNAVPALEPVVAVASLPIVGWMTGVGLIAAAIATLFRPTSYYGAAAIAAMLLLWVALLHVPALAAAPKNGGEWTGAFESFALGGAALLLFGLSKVASDYDRVPGPIASRAALIGRLMYGASMPAFGVLHFVYIAYVASVIPNWIPVHVFFAYATGTAHIASGLSILTGVLTRIAAYCTAAMFGTWVLIVHLPRVLAHFESPSEWTSMLIALGMCGGALLIAASVTNISTAPANVGDVTSAAPRAPIAA